MASLLGLTDSIMSSISCDDLLLDFSYPPSPGYMGVAAHQGKFVSTTEEIGESDPSEAIAGMMVPGGRTKKMKLDDACRIGFRMKSEVEILDDGFKWRKYGKKSVKNSPNPRNYYRCSSQDCGVKKRVERDRDDARYVVTTYEGMHNHSSPDVLPYAQAMLPSSWQMQAFGSSGFMDSQIGSFQFN
uniref:Transcription factor WRKY20 n=1 Tax=Lilium regale TaxID=82328 RepID=A0A894TLY3_LILRE|nr:transcription factor WRKY20 [Lilium regale]